MSPEGRHEAASQAVSGGIQALPSIYVIFAYLKAWPIEKWAAMAGLVFIVVQTAGYLWRLRRDILRERERVAKGLPPSGPGDLQS